MSFSIIFLFLPPQLYENVLRRWESQGSECQMSKLWRFLKVSKSISDIHQKIFGNIKWGFWTFINNFKTFINLWKCPFWSMKAKETTSLRHLQEKAFNQSRRRRKLFHVFSPKSEIKIVLFPKSEIKCIFRSQIDCSLIFYDIHLYLFSWVWVFLDRKICIGTFWQLSSWWYFGRNAIKNWCVI